MRNQSAQFEPCEMRHRLCFWIGVFFTSIAFLFVTGALHAQELQPIVMDPFVNFGVALDHAADEQLALLNERSAQFDPHYLAAAHFQNHRIPADEACYTCHTDYALYGDLRAKWSGLNHVWVQYLGKPPASEAIRLFTPYNNRECLHCHLGARSFEESPVHNAIRDGLVSNQTSCLTAECHDTVHNVAGLGKVKFWKGAP